MPDAPRDAVRTVHQDLPCRDCGYNLRSLRFDQTCPECGATVEWTTHGHLLRYASVRWLRRLHRGTRLLIVSFQLQIGFTFGLMLYAISMLPASDRMSDVVMLLLLHGSCITSLMGVYCLSTKEPRVGDDEPMNSRRCLTRLAVYAGALIWSWLLINQLNAWNSRSLYDMSTPHWLALGTWPLLMFMLIGMLATLTDRSSDFTMNHRARSLYGAMFVFFVIVGFTVFITIQTDSYYSFICGSCASLICIYILLGGMLLVLSELSSELKTSIRISGSRPWRAPSAAPPKEDTSARNE